MARPSTSRGLRPVVRSLRDSLRYFLTPGLFQQAHQACSPRRARKRWDLQPLILVLLCLTWAAGDSQAERFETARAFVIAYRPKRARPGRSIAGYHKALARLPMSALRAVAASLRVTLPRLLTRCWKVAGFIPLGCDGTRLQCPRAAPLEQRLGQAGKPNAAPTVWLTALVHLRLGVPWAWRWGKGTASERGHLRLLLAALPAAALVVTDAGFVGYDLTRTLLEQRVCFLIRVSSQATFYRAGAGAPQRFRDGLVWYFPQSKKKGRGQCPPLRVRLLRVRGRKGKDVWLMTNVRSARKLSVALAAQLYRWRWESEGFFRTFKRTLGKVKLSSRTVRLVHREAEGAMLATQLLLAQGTLALQPYRPRGVKKVVACSPREVLLAIRDELRSVRRPGGKSFGQRLAGTRRESRRRRSAKAKRPWPQRKPHKPPKPPRLLTLTEAEKAQIFRHQTEES